MASASLNWLADSEIKLCSLPRFYIEIPVAKLSTEVSEPYGLADAREEGCCMLGVYTEHTEGLGCP